MKSLRLLLVAASLLCCATALTDDETKDLTALAHELYEVEDKLDHLLYHFNHDVTHHSYRKTRFGTNVVAAPKNPNSIHQKLKLIDELNIGAGMTAAYAAAGADAYNPALGGPALAMPQHFRS